MSFLTANIVNDVLEICLNGPESGNSFGRHEAASLTEELHRQEYKNKFRAIHLKSAHPKIFCSGGNLKEQICLSSKEQGLEMHREIRASLLALDLAQVPIAASVEGDCFGGGMELISCANFIVASPAALFGFWQRRIGLTFGWGGGERWKRRVPQNFLESELYCGRSFSPYEALHFRVVDKVVPIGEADKAARAWLTKSEVNDDGLAPMIKSLRVESETDVFETLWWGREHKSFLERLKTAGKNRP